MSKHWTESLPASWECEDATDLRRIGRLIKADHVTIEKYRQVIFTLEERIMRLEKLADRIADRHFTEEELEAMYKTDTLITPCHG